MFLYCLWNLKVVPPLIPKSDNLCLLSFSWSVCSEFYSQRTSFYWLPLFFCFCFIYFTFIFFISFLLLTLGLICPSFSSYLRLELKSVFLRLFSCFKIGILYIKFLLNILYFHFHSLQKTCSMPFLFLFLTPEIFRSLWFSFQIFKNFPDMYITDCNFHSTEARKHTLNNLNPFQITEICFVASKIVCIDKWSMCP